MMPSIEYYLKYMPDGTYKKTFFTNQENDMCNCDEDFEVNSDSYGYSVVSNDYKRVLEFAASVNRRVKWQCDQGVFWLEDLCNAKTDNPKSGCYRVIYDMHEGEIPHHEERILWWDDCNLAHTGVFFNENGIAKLQYPYSNSTFQYWMKMPEAPKKKGT